MSLMDIELTADGSGYDVPGVGVVPRVSTLLDLLDHPAARNRIENWRLKCAIRGGVQLYRDGWQAQGYDVDDVDWPVAEIDDQHVADALALGGADWQATQGTEQHEDLAEVLSAWDPIRREQGDVQLRHGLLPAAEKAFNMAFTYGLDDAVAAHVERTAYIPDLGVAGTPDLVIVHEDDGVTIIDWKCGTPHWRRWRRQLRAYSLPWVDRGYTVLDLVVVQLGVGPQPAIPIDTARATSLVAGDPTPDFLALQRAAEVLRLATESEKRTATPKENV